MTVEVPARNAALAQPFVLVVVRVFVHVVITALAPAA